MGCLSNILHIETFSIVNQPTYDVAYVSTLEETKKKNKTKIDIIAWPISDAGPQKSNISLNM